MEPLLPHFCQYYEMDEQLVPPIKLEACAKLQVAATASAAHPAFSERWARGGRSLKATSCLARAGGPRAGGGAPAAPAGLCAAAAGCGAAARCFWATPACKAAATASHAAECCARCSAEELEDGSAKGASEALRKCFAALRTRLVDCPLEGFQFDRSTDFT